MAVALLVFAGAAMAAMVRWREAGRREAARTIAAVSAMGVTDICVATEARYTRHPAVSDPLAPFMDHPGAFEHFPTGSFWAPVAWRRTASAGWGGGS